MALGASCRSGAASGPKLDLHIGPPTHPADAAVNGSQAKVVSVGAGQSSPSPHEPPTRATTTLTYFHILET
jgi:hypothetical protein